MRSTSSSQIARWAGVASILVVTIGLVYAMHASQAANTALFDMRGTAVILVLWVTNLVSFLLNAFYWCARGRPNWLTRLLVIQLSAVLALLAVVALPETAFY